MEDERIRTVATLGKCAKVIFLDQMKITSNNYMEIKRRKLNYTFDSIEHSVRSGQIADHDAEHIDNYIQHEDRRKRLSLDT